MNPALLVQLILGVALTLPAFILSAASTPPAQIPAPRGAAPIVAQGSPQELKQQTGKDSLEETFLALTGSTIRDEAATSADQMRQVARMWGNRR